MTCNVIQSGSDGNCLILNGIISLDMGVAYKKVDPYVKGLQLVFCGHDHIDHFKKSTIRAIASKRPMVRFVGGEWMAKEFIKAGVQPRQIDVLEAGKRYDYRAFQIEPVPLVHDVPNFGLKIYMGGKSAIYAVDTGTLDGVEAKDFDMYMIEANHRQGEIKERIAEKVERGEYAYELRARRNHLSEEQAMDWIARNAGAKSLFIPLHQHREK